MPLSDEGKNRLLNGKTETCPVRGDLCAVKMVNELFGTVETGKGKEK
jgi:hypothetical protein